MKEHELAHIRYRLRDLESQEVKLQEFADLSLDDVASEDVHVGFQLMLAVQACVGISSCLAGAEGWRLPETHADIFQILKEQEVIEPTLADRMGELSKFGRLTFILIPISILHSAIISGVEDFPIFAEQITKYVEQGNK